MRPAVLVLSLALSGVASAQSINIDFQPFQRSAEIGRINAVALYVDRTHGMEENFVGIGRQQVLLLAEIVAKGNHPRAGFTKTAQGTTQLTGATDANILHLIQVEQNKLLERQFFSSVNVKITVKLKRTQAS